MLREIVQNEDFDTLIEAVVKSGTRDIRLMYLESILNLIQIEETAPEMVRHGLLDTLAGLYSQSPDIDIARISAKILDKLVRNVYLRYPTSIVQE